MRRSALALALALAPVLACSPSPAETGGSEPPPWSPPDEAGPYAAGVTTLEFTDPRGKDLVVEVWYPAAPEEGDQPDPYPEIVIVGEAFREAPPDPRGAPYPLVAFSHGYSAIRYQSVFLTEYLAQHGFVVVSPDHVHNTMLDLDEDLTGLVMLERPDDIRYSVDEALSVSAGDDPLLGGMIRGDTYAMTGHSFGAVTTQTVAGGRLDWLGFQAWCEENGSWVCGLMEGVDPATFDQYGTDDPRAVVAMPMAPGAWFAYEDQGGGLAGVRQPLVWGGTRDDVLDYDEEIRPCYEHMAPPKRMATLAEAGHYAFSDICRIASFLFDDCDPALGFLDMERAHAIIRPIALAYLGVAFLDDDRYAPWLEADSLGGIPELTWESE